MLRINTLRALPILAAAGLSAALAIPSVAGAAGSSGLGAGKVSYSDLSVTMSTSDSAGSHHSGSVSYSFGDGSVRFDPYGGFLGGVVVATGDVDGVTGRITAVTVDPSDPVDDGSATIVTATDTQAGYPSNLEVTVKVLN